MNTYTITMVALDVIVGFVWGITAQRLLNPTSTLTRYGIVFSCYLLACLLVPVAMRAAS